MLVWLALMAAWPSTVFSDAPAASGDRTAMARDTLRELIDRSARLREQAAADPALAACSNDIVRVHDAAQDVLSLLDQAELQAAEAWVEMACYAAWVVSRESKKKAASLRLIEITRATGKEGEIERYEARHEMLLATIRDAAHRYADILRELGSLSAAATEHGLSRHAEELRRRELSGRIEVLNKVREHLGEAPATTGSVVDLSAKWQRELEEL